jgi:hypothetical protein
LLQPASTPPSAPGPRPARESRHGAAPGHGDAVRPEGAPRPHRPRGNLRARLTSFVGRDADIRTLRDDLRAARLVTLLGPGGAGKTRLSQEAAEAAGTSPGTGRGWPSWPRWTTRPPYRRPY